MLVPWAEIAPDFEVPGAGTVRDLLQACPDAGAVTPIDQGNSGNSVMSG